MNPCEWHAESVEHISITTGEVTTVYTDAVHLSLTGRFPRLFFCQGRVRSDCDWTVRQLAL